VVGKQGAGQVFLIYGTAAQQGLSERDHHLRVVGVASGDRTSVAHFESSWQGIARHSFVGHPKRVTNEGS
jgi:hypothetical protein